MKLKTTAIVCAFNEEKTIESILSDVCEIKFFDDVIVINDGSQDETKSRINELKLTKKFTAIHLAENKGKGFAMAKGTVLAKTEFLVFIDADLSNFTHKHALELLIPVLNGKADMVLGQPTKTLIHPDINPFKSLSGQRALKKMDIMPLLEQMKTVRYGVETLINIHYKTMHKKVKYVSLENLSHPSKFQKTKFPIAIKEYIMAGYQILETIFSNFNVSMKLNKNRVSNPLSINN